MERKRYYIATGHLDALEKEVDQKLNQGWELHGVLVNTDELCSKGKVFAQVLVKTSREPLPNAEKLES